MGDACNAYYFLRDWARLTRDPKLTLSPPYFVKDSLMPSISLDDPLFSPVTKRKKGKIYPKEVCSLGIQDKRA